MPETTSGALGAETATADPLEDLAAELAARSVRYLAALRQVSAGESPQNAVSILLLETAEILLGGALLGATRDVLPEYAIEPDDGVDPEVEGWRAPLRASLGPADEYDDVVDPYAPGAEPERTRLSDNLVEVAADLVHGLTHYRCGRVREALWWWQFTYLAGWGAAACSAQRALQSLIAHVRLDESA